MSSRGPGKKWSISAGWFDYNNDGRLDLFVVNYCKWSPEADPYCGEKKPGYRAYCHPKFYEGLPNTLYRNNGNGTFTDVSAAAGIEPHIGKGMAVAFADYDLDGWLDAFVTNDTERNFLFRNLKKLRRGRPQGGCGVQQRRPGAVQHGCGLSRPGQRRPPGPSDHGTLQRDLRSLFIATVATARSPMRLTRVVSVS